MLKCNKKKATSLTALMVRRCWVLWCIHRLREKTIFFCYTNDDSWGAFFLIMTRDLEVREGNIPHHSSVPTISPLCPVSIRQTSCSFSNISQLNSTKSIRQGKETCHCICASSILILERKDVEDLKNKHTFCPRASHVHHQW